MIGVCASLHPFPWVGDTSDRLDSLLRRGFEKRIHEDEVLRAG